MQWTSEGTLRCQELGGVLGFLLLGQGMDARSRTVIYPSLPGEAGAPLESAFFTLHNKRLWHPSICSLLPSRQGRHDSPFLFIRTPPNEKPQGPRAQDTQDRI